MEIEALNRRDEHEAEDRCAASQGSHHGSHQAPRDALVAGSSTQPTQQPSCLTAYVQQHRDDDLQMHMGPFDSLAHRHIVFDDKQLNVPMPMALLPPQQIYVTVPPVHSVALDPTTSLGRGIAAHLGVHLQQLPAQLSTQSQQQTAAQQQAPLPFVYPGKMSAHSDPSEAQPQGANWGAGGGVVLQHGSSHSQPLTPIHLPLGGLSHRQRTNHSCSRSQHGPR